MGERWRIWHHIVWSLRSQKLCFEAINYYGLFQIYAMSKKEVRHGCLAPATWNWTCCFRMSPCQQWTSTHSNCQRAPFQISHTQWVLLAVSWLDIILRLCRPNWWMSQCMYYDRIHLLWSAVLSYLVMLFSPPHLVHFSGHKDKGPDNYTKQLSISKGMALRAAS